MSIKCRWRLLIFTACLFWLMGAMTALGAENQAEKGPVVVVPESHFDFGNVFEGDELLHDFILRNTGSEDLIIQNVKTG